MNRKPAASSVTKVVTDVPRNMVLWPLLGLPSYAVSLTRPGQSGHTVGRTTTRGAAMNTRIGALMIAGALSLAGCGGGGGQDYGSAAEVAKAAGCGGYEKSETQMFTQETGSCQIDGKDVYVMTFADEAARDNWMKTAKSAGASGFFGEGAKWVLQSDDKAVVEKGAKAAGGEVK